MIRYSIKNRTIEIEYDTGLELSYIKKLLDMIDIINEAKNGGKDKH